MAHTILSTTRHALGAALACCATAVCAAPAFVPADQPYGSVPPLSLTGFNLAQTQKAFQAWFDPYTWSGDLVAYPVGANGQVQYSSKLWSVHALLDAKQACYSTGPGSLTYYDTGRKIVTRAGSPVGNKPFRWANLTAAEQATIGDATTGPKLLNFIRGDRSNEIYQQELAGDGSIQFECGVKSPGTGLFRARTGIFGDIMHARPVFVGAPPADYLFDDYLTFKAAKASRAQRVYVGANDGMVHAFDVATGDEVWAYIPSPSIGSLKDLATDPYTHRYFVDGGSGAGDVNFGTSAAPDWRTVLVGSTGAGGKTLYALDVTDPDASSEAVAAGKILWEITPSSAGFGSLGYTYGTPVIARLNTGQWAVIVGNGYVNAGTGHAVLYIIDIKTGALIKALDTGSGSLASPNGLSSPLTVDTNFDGKVDRVYAGDIDGNMWKFDISATSAASWTAPSTPLYATGKSIVSAPDVVAHPISGYLVYFATGRLFTDADAADASVQNYAYGIWDGAPAANNTLLNQTLTATTYGALRVRVTSGLPINWNDYTNVSLKPAHFGWRTALPPGERVIGAGFVRDARYHFSSVNPTIDQVPDPNGENWLVELDYETGGARDKPIFDLNADGLLTDADRIVSGGVPVAGAAGIPVSVYMGAGLASQPVLAIVSAQLSTTLFNTNPYVGPDVVPSNPGITGDPGVSGGHFDVDIYYGGTDDHTHEYDDKFNVTGVNFLNASDPSKNIENAISSTGTKFKILISNQTLSPAVSFSFGGNPYIGVTKLGPWITPGLTMASLPVFTRANVNTLKFRMPKDAFEVKDWAGDNNARVGLQPTQTGCVNKGTPGTLGPNGEYRNGALTFQLVKDTTPDSVVQLSQPGDPRYGYRVKTANWGSYVLAEWTVFWHHPNKACMGDAGWTDKPPQDFTTAVQKTLPAPGAEDPPFDELGTITSSVTSTVADSSCSGCKITTTVVTYSTGAVLTITSWTDNKGNITKVEIDLKPPPPGAGGGAGGGGGVGQGNSTNVLTGYQQARAGGKLGRITWHELLRQ